MRALGMTPRRCGALAPLAARVWQLGEQRMCSAACGCSPRLCGYSCGGVARDFWASCQRYKRARTRRADVRAVLSAKSVKQLVTRTRSPSLKTTAHVSTSRLIACAQRWSFLVHATHENRRVAHTVL